MGQEEDAAATCSTYSGKLKDMQLCIDRRNQLCGRLFRSIRESCLVTDPSEVFLPRYGPLRSVFASLQAPQKCCFGQVRDLSFLIGVDCVVVGVSMITRLKILLMNVCNSCTPYSHDQSLSQSK